MAKQYTASELDGKSTYALKVLMAQNHLPTTGITRKEQMIAALAAGEVTEEIKAMKFAPKPAPKRKRYKASLHKSATPIKDEHTLKRWKAQEGKCANAEDVLNLPTDYLAPSTSASASPSPDVGVVPVPVLGQPFLLALNPFLTSQSQPTSYQGERAGAPFTPGINSGMLPSATQSPSPAETGNNAFPTPPRSSQGSPAADEVDVGAPHEPDPDCPPPVATPTPRSTVNGVDLRGNTSGALPPPLNEGDSQWLYNNLNVDRELDWGLLRDWNL
ncbi:hypothetical protein BCR34DRAFT_606592 [Clohesyomyces aquaticus]|uniref:Uncharacterized protein n=1 Tax=Clohesyomyces aquaticus TaxID=1231657 RepID=A0A1Y1YNS3_9PLEO|nr:hypothetical protein BCR34DRAFT_606592 [Clohesyomyces aquaticus]